jgi:drug/metabolite transporter (DMT)-like permease
MAGNIWFFYALFSALLWGISYSFSDRLLQSGISVPLLMAIEGIMIIPILAVVALKGNPFDGIHLLMTDRKILVLAIFVALTAMLGSFFILMSISEKNATLASLIEITYPLFTCLFAWLFFKDMQLSWTTAMGALLILSGIAVIYVKG